MPPSITFWNRLEPRPRTNSIAESLAAPCRSALAPRAAVAGWKYRKASDCGSPAYVDLRAQAGPLVGWASANGASRPPWTGPMPPDRTHGGEDEPFSADLVTRAELGQWFEAMLGAESRPADDRGSAFGLSASTDP